MHIRPAQQVTMLLHEWCPGTKRQQQQLIVPPLHDISQQQHPHCSSSPLLCFVVLVRLSSCAHILLGINCASLALVCPSLPKAGCTRRL